MLLIVLALSCIHMFVEGKVGGCFMSQVSLMFKNVAESTFSIADQRILSDKQNKIKFVTKNIS